MIYPITAFGDPILKKVTSPIEQGYPGLQQLISDMYETMSNASGIGLAAPQIGLSIRLFVIDTSQLKDEAFRGETGGIRKVFINAKMIKELGEPWAYEEGCLSIPGIREDVWRRDQIVIEYQDEDFNTHRETYDDINARVIQHEYDHIEGILFVDHLKPLKKRLIRKRLNQISMGEVDVKYKMKFPVRT